MSARQVFSSPRERLFSVGSHLTRCVLLPPPPLEAERQLCVEFCFSEVLLHAARALTSAQPRLAPRASRLAPLPTSEHSAARDPLARGRPRRGGAAAERERVAAAARGEPLGPSCRQARPELPPPTRGAPRTCAWGARGGAAGARRGDDRRARGARRSRAPPWAPPLARPWRRLHFWQSESQQPQPRNLVVSVRAPPAEHYQTCGDVAGSLVP